MVNLEGVPDDEDNNCLAFDAVDWVIVCRLCRRDAVQLDPKYKPNYLIVHPDGYALNEQNEPLSTHLLAERLTLNLLSHMSRFAKELQTHAPESAFAACRENGPPVFRILVFVHGGLNGYDASFEHMQQLVDRVKGSQGEEFNVIKDTCYYPLFINWNSALLDSLADDLFRVRFGQPDLALAITTSPFVIASHLIGSLGNFPVSFIHNGQLLVERIRGALEENDPGYCVVADTIGYLPLHALYVGTIPLLEGFGGPTWDIMKRRAQLAVADQLVDVPGTQNATFQRVAQYTSKSRKADAPLYNEGAVRTLVKALHQKLVYQNGEWKWGDNGVPVELTLVGHSMGSMVINRVLSLVEGVHRTERTPVENIIYLAPAASIDELERLTIPYLEQANVGKAAKLHPTQLWMFGLNRRDETREIPWQSTLGLMPRGSLLTWIDTFLERETTWGQSTSGRTWNLLHAHGLEPSEPPPPKGTRNCFTPFWDPAGGIPPERRPLTAQFRERRLAPGSVHRHLQDKNLLKLYDSPRRIGAHNVPEEHGDFTTPTLFLEALCQVTTAPFRMAATCDQPAGMDARK